MSLVELHPPARMTYVKSRLPAWAKVCGRVTLRQGVSARALGSKDGDDESVKRIQRGNVAAPLRVFSPLAEASISEQLASTSGLGTSVLGSIDPNDNVASISTIMSPVKDDMEQMRQNLRNVVGKRHPLLLTAADQIFSAGGKRLRPLICFLVARATISLSDQRYGRIQLVEYHLFNDCLQTVLASECCCEHLACGVLMRLCKCFHCSDIGEKHRRLAEIVEMIHTASLVHDDVLDDCDLRRGT